MSTASKAMYSLLFIAYGVVIVGILVRGLPMSDLISSPPVGQIVLATLAFALLVTAVAVLVSRFGPSEESGA